MITVEEVDKRAEEIRLEIQNLVSVVKSSISDKDSKVEYQDIFNSILYRKFAEIELKLEK